MRILSIEIMNLASLEGDHLVDFTAEPLKSAGIFAITGPTGAGKSTVLDALCLALYGKTPRYFQANERGIKIQDTQGSIIQQNDPRGILRDGTAEGSASVKFIGTDQQTYKATWQIKRARLKAEGKLQPVVISLYNESAAANVSGKTAELFETIERLVGLSFEQFTRSVLLAQGDFTAFMRADKDEKSALLEKLTGTQIYSEISQTVYRHYKEHTEAVQVLKNKQGLIETLEPEIVSAIEKQLAEKQATTVQTEAKEGQLSQDIDWHYRLAAMSEVLKTAIRNHESGIIEKQQGHQRQIYLNKAEAVQPTRLWVDQLTATKKNYVENSTLLHKLSGELREKEAAKASLADDLKTAGNYHQQAIDNQQTAQPMLEEAKKLDILIKSTASLFNINKQAAADFQQKKKAHEEKINLSHTKITELRNQQEDVEKWLSEHSAKASIAENETLILSKLQDAQKYLQELDLQETALNQLKQSLTELVQSKPDKQKVITAIQTSLGEAIAQSQLVEKSIQAIAISSIEQQLEDANTMVTQLLDAQYQYTTLQQHYKNNKILKEKENNTRQLLQQYQNGLHPIKAALPTAKTALDTTRQLLDRAKTSLAENVTTLREQLEKGVPCPVCGSLEHPYHTQAPIAHNILTELTQSLNEADTLYTGLLAKQQELNTAIKHQASMLENLNLDLLATETVINQSELIWQSSEIYPLCKDTGPENISKWLKQEHTTQLALAEKLKVKQKQYYSLKEQLSKLQVGISQLKDSLNAEQDKLNNINAAITNKTQEKQQLVRTLSNLQERLKDLQKELSVFFLSVGWFENWKKTPDNFKKTVTEFSTKWRTKIQQQEKLKAENELSQASHLSLKQTDLSLTEDLKEKQARLDKENAELLGLQKERQNIFEGKPVEQLLLVFKKEIDRTKDAAEKAGTTLTELTLQCTRLTTQKEGLEKEISLKFEQQNDYQQQIDTWRYSHPQTNSDGHPEILSIDQLNELLRLTPEWIDEQRQALLQLNINVEKLATTVLQRKTDIAEHITRKKTEDSLETLSASLEQTKQQLAGLRAESADLQARLKYDQANKKKIEHILRDLIKQEQVLENWSQLNSVIGSQDGKKFRQIAQEYTLDLLLNYANYHLKTLSKRYLLQRIPSTLGLQVVDQDMGDEVRTVYSLSGGESFLVSLALALGLASLSSKKMSVQSLFIDEGFGSLDPTTLNIAMDALERLHDQGRKVGVISHVQEMTERIPIQIKVNKLASGKSAIEVVNL